MDDTGKGKKDLVYLQQGITSGSLLVFIRNGFGHSISASAYMCRRHVTDKTKGIFLESRKYNTG
jgi:hypothetical protein